MQYCTQSLEPIGAVVKGESKSLRGIKKAYKVSGIGLKYGLPFTGLLLEWSEKYPEISLQQILGPTRAEGRNGERAPVFRLKIFEDLLTSSDSTISVKNIANSLQTSMKRVDSTMVDIEHEDLIVIERKDITSRVIKIEDPAYRHVAIDFSDLSSETKAIYTTTQRLYSQGIREISLADLIDQVAQESGIEASIIRYRLGRGLGEGHFPGIVSDNLPSEPREKTKIIIKPEYLSAISSLIDITEKMRQPSVELLEQGSKTARQILGNEDRVAGLMLKARSYSNNANRTDIKQFKDTVEKLLTEAGRPLSQKELMEKIIGGSQRKLSKETVRRLVNRIANEKNSSIAVESQPINNRSRRIAKFVMLASAEK